MSKSLYPTKRQKNVACNFDVLPSPKQTLAINVAVFSIFFFRMIMRAVILIYLLLTVIGAFETFSVFMGGDHKNAVLSVTKTIFILMMTGSMIFLHNQILMMLGHGYKSKDAQLVIDRYSDFNECNGAVSVLKSMYFVVFAMAALLLWIVWGFWGTPFYKDLFANQWLSLKAVFEHLSLLSDSPLTGSDGSTHKKLIPFLWIVTAGLVTIIFLSALGWLQAFIAKFRMVKSSLAKK